MAGSSDNKELVEKILDLKKRRNAVILTHNYQRPEVQDIGDFVGDSLELSRKAAKTDADIIVFCGVHFMAETASILCPDKVVLLPDSKSGCPMADMITAEALVAKKKEADKARVVCYVNSSAAVKAESDICCTSANALDVVKSMGDGEIIFIPDQYLGNYVATRLKRTMILWPGYCPTHMRIMQKDILKKRKEHPDALVLVHPECRSEAVGAADQVLSTGGMLRFVQQSSAKEFIIGTEVGILHRMRKENPGKTFIPVSEKAVCPNMKKITLEKVALSLENMAPVVKVPEDIRARATSAVDKMLAI